MNTLDTYFSLFETAGNDPKDFEQLISLFAKDAVIDPMNGIPVVGISDIEIFFKAFFLKNIVLKCVWESNYGKKFIEVKWGVVGKRKCGGIFTLKGSDLAQLDEEGKITSLEITVED